MEINAMAERRYSLSEIDEMRTLVASRMGYGYGKDDLVYIEQMLRTLMMNGTELEELREEKKRADAAEAAKVAERAAEIANAVAKIAGCPVCGAKLLSSGYGGLRAGHRTYTVVSFACHGQGYIADGDNEPQPLKLNDAWCAKEQKPMADAAVWDYMFERRPNSNTPATKG